MIEVLNFFSHTAQWLVGGAIVFGVLTALMPCNRGVAWWKENLWTDFTYLFIIPFATRWVGFMMMLTACIIVYGMDVNDETMQHFFDHGTGGVLSELPLELQCVLYLIVSDVYLYWMHRYFHAPSMWKYHAIHHATKHLDWLHSSRFHPINLWLTFVLVDVLCIMIGFSPAAIAALFVFNKIYSMMVHANLNWTFGPFKYVLSSPVFHRWHHTQYDEGGSKNFAPTFPILDIIFGTFYMPKDKIPEHYGVDHPLPEDPLGQLLYPFKK